MNTSLVDSAAILGAVVVCALSIFQISLAAGAPLGHAAFGGENKVLSKKLRIVSAASAIVFVAAFYVILARSGLFGGASKSLALVRAGIWVLVVIFGLSTIANVASRSHVERRVMSPVALLLAVCCLTVALS
jgi:hypothetical protein